jgi:hypothetical protein
MLKAEPEGRSVLRSRGLKGRGVLKGAKGAVLRSGGVSRSVLTS